MRSLLLAALLLGLATGAGLAAPLAIGVAAADAIQDPSIDQTVLALKLTPESTQAFADFTAAHVGETIVLRVGGEIVLKAILREPIRGGELRVAGDYSEDEIRGFVARISSGAAKVEVEAPPD